MRVHLDAAAAENDGTVKNSPRNVPVPRKGSKRKVIKKRRMPLQTVCTTNTPEKMIVRNKQKRKREPAPVESVAPVAKKAEGAATPKTEDTAEKVAVIDLREAAATKDGPKRKKFRACMGTHLQKRSPKQEKDFDYVHDTRYGTCDIQ
jgi:hypothetical protein